MNDLKPSHYIIYSRDGLLILELIYQITNVSASANSIEIIVKGAFVFRLPHYSAYLGKNLDLLFLVSTFLKVHFNQ